MAGVDFRLAESAGVPRDFDEALDRFPPKFLFDGPHVFVEPNQICAFSPLNGFFPKCATAPLSEFNNEPDGRPRIPVTDALLNRLRAVHGTPENLTPDIYERHNRWPALTRQS